MACKECEKCEKCENATSGDVKRGNVRVAVRSGEETLPQLRGRYHAFLLLAEPFIAIGGDVVVYPVANEGGDDHEKEHKPPCAAYQPEGMQGR